MLLSEHLHELKMRLFVVVIFFIVTFAAIYVNVDMLLDDILGLGKQVGYEIVYLSPTEVLVQQINFTCTCTFYVIVPITMYEIIMFIAPAVHESLAVKVKLMLFACYSYALFDIGMIFAYRIMVPFMYKFLFDLGVLSGITATISLEKYLSVFLMLIRCLGIIFQMPLLCILLAKIGLVTANGMKRFRRIATVIIFIIAALITPPDVISQCIVAIPMLVLYNVSILLVRYTRKDMV